MDWSSPNPKKKKLQHFIMFNFIVVKINLCIYCKNLEDVLETLNLIFIIVERSSLEANQLSYL
uniref:Uncharacterized protein n=1 Tax=Manihot esculenta TaxID=3983 RepID=A0A2C9V6A4_MANES